MRKQVFLLLAFLMALSGVIVNAQDGGELQCDATEVADGIQWAIDALTAAQNTTVEEQYQAIVDVRSTLAALDSECLGLDLEGNDNTVTDMVFVPEGIYRATAKTEHAIIVEGTVLEGECGTPPLISGEWFLLLSETSVAPQGSQAMLKSSGCLLIWQISNVRAPWSVTFEKLR